MTYRRMAEWATNLACKKIGLAAKFETAAIYLPGSVETVEKKKDSNNFIIDYKTS